MLRKRWTPPICCATLTTVGKPATTWLRQMLLEAAQILPYCWSGVMGPTGGHNRELLVLTQIRKFHTGWYWFSFLDYSPQTE